jgi:hypothetical protein
MGVVVSMNQQGEPIRVITKQGGGGLMGKIPVHRDGRERHMIVVSLRMLEELGIVHVPVRLPVQVGIVEHEAGAQWRPIEVGDLMEKMKDREKTHPILLVEDLEEVALGREVWRLHGEQVNVGSTGEPLNPQILALRARNDAVAGVLRQCANLQRGMKQRTPAKPRREPRQCRKAHVARNGTESGPGLGEECEARQARPGDAEHLCARDSKEQCGVKISEARVPPDEEVNREKLTQRLQQRLLLRTGLGRKDGDLLSVHGASGE